MPGVERTQGRSSRPRRCASAETGTSLPNLTPCRRPCDLAGRFRPGSTGPDASSCSACPSCSSSCSRASWADPPTARTRRPAPPTQAGATIDETSQAPTSGPTVGAKTGAGKKGKKKRNQETTPPEPVLAEPTGPCADSDIVATPAITSAPGGSDIPITINLRTIVTAACTWQASPQTLTVTITSGDDYIWSTRECPVAIPVQDVVIRQAVDTPVVVTWSARRSDETCSDRTEWAIPGFYHVEAAALGGDATDVQFELLRGSGDHQDRGPAAGWQEERRPGTRRRGRQGNSAG